jgi:hypothetical protein
MPYTLPNGKRDYVRQGKLQDAKPSARQARADNVKMNRELVKAGRGHKGDGLDAGHKVAESKGGPPTLSNTQLQTPSANRSFSRNADSSMKSERSKKGK